MLSGGRSLLPAGRRGRCAGLGDMARLPGWGAVAAGSTHPEAWH